MLLENKIALITGAARGIGRGIALRFAQEGARIAGIGRDPGTLAKLSAEIEEAGGEALMTTGSVARRDDVQRAVDATMAKYHRIDILVNNAGSGLSKPFLELTEDDWDEVLNTDLKGMFLFSQAVAREMRQTGGGRIINIASICSVRVNNDDMSVLYHVAKGAIPQLTASSAAALAQHGITVNAIAPGWVNTDMTRANIEADTSGAILTRIISRRIATPDDVAQLALFLATEQTHFLVGQTILLDGGQSLLL
jgi:3-oxoacyl-[acyl-carrier protein] reductase